MAELLNLNSLANALQRFEEALQACAREPNNSLYRDACIQRFEFSYELSHKMLKRYLELTSANTIEIDEMPFQTLIRTGNEQGLLRSSWERWKDYRVARNISSHTYDEQKAMDVMAIAPDFYVEARSLFNSLSSRNQLQI